MRNRDEEELIGSAPRPGEDPRFADGEGVWLDDNGAGVQIEDFDHFDPVDVDLDPYLPGSVDDDGSPGFHPFVAASKSFEQQEGIETDESSEGDRDLSDEFVERVQQRGEALVGDDGRPVSDLVMLAKVGQAQKEALASEAGFVRINPPSAAEALLGGQVVLVTGDPNVEAARWTSQSQIESCPVTVALSEVSPDTLSTTAKVGTPAGSVKPLRPFAIVTYGTRNAPVSFEVDIGVGTQFTVGATALNVQLGLDPCTDATFAGKPAQQMALAAQLSFYPVVRTAPVTRTLYSDQVVAPGPAIATRFLVPYYSKSLTLVRQVSTAIYTILFASSDNLSQYSVTVPVGTNVTVPIPLSGDIFTVVVIGGVAGGIDRYRLIFELSL